jgi:UMF1 family MFS transporter
VQSEPDARPAPASTWLTRRVLGWALFDVASSTYVAVVPTFFGLYFTSVVAGGHPSAPAWWGLVAAASLLLAGLLAPVAGAYADRGARWLRVVVGATALCALAAVSLPLAAKGGAVAAALVFLAAQVGYTLAASIYDSLVVDVASPQHRGRISALGWSLGLLGGIVVIVAALLLMQGVAPAEQAQQLGPVFVVAGVLFAVLAVPGIAGLRGLRASAAPPSSPVAGLGASLRAVAATVRRWREHRPALQVLASFFLINDVLVTIHFFTAIVLSARFGLTVEGLLWLALLYHLVAIPSTVAFGTLTDRLGSKPAVLAMCATLSGAILLLAFGVADWVPVAAVVLLGLVLASVQAVFRSLYASLVPPAQASELFGFNAVAGRLSAALGPLIYGVTAAIFGSNTWALCLLFLPLAAGASLLAAADLSSHHSAGEDAAQAVAPRSTESAS